MTAIVFILEERIVIKIINRSFSMSYQNLTTNNKKAKHIRTQYYQHTQQRGQ